MTNEVEQGPLILLADDDMEMTRVLRKGLEKQGLRIVEAYDGQDAYRLIEEKRPDLVVLDVMMPVQNGWEVCRAVRANEAIAKTPIIMLTGIGPNLNEMTSPLYGADEYLDKPVELPRLIERIKALLAAGKG